MHDLVYNWQNLHVAKYILSDVCPSCAKLEACLEKTQDSKGGYCNSSKSWYSCLAMTAKLKEQADAFKAKEEETKLLLSEKENVGIML